MRILFVIDNLGRTRHFRNVIRALAEREHTIVLACGGEAKKAKGGFYQNPRVEIVASPTRRADDWAALIDPVRRMRDYLRYLDPEFACSVDLARRAAKRAPKRWVHTLDRHTWLKRRWKLVEQVLAIAESVTPCDPEIRRFVTGSRADLMIVTPLVDFNSYQTDYVKCAHQLGVPVAFLPFSWDNLTSKGLIRVPPDRVLVWNTQQKLEAIEFHDVPSDRIVITGAPRFDDFFSMQPASSRKRFCERLGLDPARPLLLYVCSASPIAPNEVPFVRRWIMELRRAEAADWLRDCSVLIRPHPASQDEWQTADFSDLPRVAVWSRRSTMNADQGLFDSLFHVTAVVGLNTSAMIEAAIVGRPVFTISAPEFAGGQCGTLHFRHLLTDYGGIVSMRDAFDDHFHDIAAAPDRTEETIDRSRRFLNAFVRPQGVDTSASSIMVEELERAASLHKRPHRTPLWHYPVRWALKAAVRVGLDRRRARS